MAQWVWRHAHEAWDYLREVMGDRAYERYLEVATNRRATPLTAEEFYLDSVNRRYSTVSRCC
ncbi:MAG: putative selenoprotein [Vicinamibacteria bacterium]|nr:putative selenoprotein [Vicinamibacteria bacterium]